MIKGASTNCIRFPVFGAIKRALQGPDADRPLPPLQAMLAGGTAGAISAGATHPIDTILGNMQGLESRGATRAAGSAANALFTTPSRTSSATVVTPNVFVPRWHPPPQ